MIPATWETETRKFEVQSPSGLQRGYEASLIYLTVPRSARAHGENRDPLKLLSVDLHVCERVTDCQKVISRKPERTYMGEHSVP